MFRGFTNPKTLALLGLVIAGTVYLTFWHGPHLATAAPLLLILVYPLMHQFMHGGHLGPHHRSTRPVARTNTSAKED